MAASESLTRSVLVVADVPGGLALSDAAGWNQTADDWRLFIERGEVLGCRNGDGELVATAAALPYGAEQGWISMVLVDAQWRHRGLATDLMNDRIGWLRAAGVDAGPGRDAGRRSGVPTAGVSSAGWSSSAGRRRDQCRNHRSNHRSNNGRHRRRPATPRDRRITSVCVPRGPTTSIGSSRSTARQTWSSGVSCSRPFSRAATRARG